MPAEPLVERADTTRRGAPSSSLVVLAVPIIREMGGGFDKLNHRGLLAPIGAR